ncbi:MAG: TPM domain-containing protein [Anaerovibrio sp.]|nr:TPM domain-containing protein [Anaerovibrio sp.]
MRKLLTVFMSLLLMLALTVPVMAGADISPADNLLAQTTTSQKDPKAIGQIKLPADLGMVSLFDMENLLKPDQQQALMQKLIKIEDKYNVRVVVMTVPKDAQTGSESGIKKFADETLNRNYRDEANNNGSIMMVVCPSARKWAVTTDNNMRERITDENGFPAIRDSFMSDLKDNDYNGAFNAYADKVDELLAYYEKEGEPWDPANEFSFLGLILGALISAGIAYLFVSHLRGNMSNVRHVSEANEYLNRDSVNISRQSDVFLHTTRTVTKRAKSDNSSSSSGRSSSNGGGSGSY